MATSLLIGYPDIPARAIRIYGDLPYATDTNVFNLIRSERHHVAQQIAASTTNQRIRFILPDGQSAAANFVILAHANWIKANVGTFRVQAATSDGGSWGDIFSDGSFSSATLLGPRSHDYLGTFTTSAAYRAWALRFESLTSTKLPLSKAYLGQWLDLQSEPTSFEVTVIGGLAAAYESGNGRRHFAVVATPRHKVTLGWTGLSDAAATDFMEKIALRRHIDRFYLYTADRHEVLGGLRLLHCRCTAASRTFEDGSPNWNRIDATFEELEG